MISTVVDTVEMRHVDEAVADQVRAFFAGKVKDFVQDGDRSVRFAHPLGGGLQLKIKGAGMKGGGIQFGTQHKAGPKAPLFRLRWQDDGGRRLGSRQRICRRSDFPAVRHRIPGSNLLASLGYSVVPCLGFGRVEKAGLSSWFSVFEMRSDWVSVKPPEFSLEDYCEAKRAIGQLLLDLAVKHDLIGHAWYVGKPSGQRYIKDLHPFRMADPVSMSQLSWVMQLFFRCTSSVLPPSIFRKSCGRKSAGEIFKPSAFMRSCQLPVRPTMRRSESTLVARYMLGVPHSFDRCALVAVLHGNPITRAMLQLCPRKYERY